MAGLFRGSPTVSLSSAQPRRVSQDRQETAERTRCVRDGNTRARMHASRNIVANFALQFQLIAPADADVSRASCRGLVGLCSRWIPQPGVRSLGNNRESQPVDHERSSERDPSGEPESVYSLERQCCRSRASAHLRLLSGTARTMRFNGRQPVAGQGRATAQTPLRVAEPGHRCAGRASAPPRESASAQLPRWAGETGSAPRRPDCLRTSPQCLFSVRTPVSTADIRSAVSHLAVSLALDRCWARVAVSPSASLPLAAV